MFVVIAPTKHERPEVRSTDSSFQYAPVVLPFGMLFGMPMDCHVCALSGETATIVAKTKRNEIPRMGSFSRMNHNKVTRTYFSDAEVVPRAQGPNSGGTANATSCRRTS